MAKALTVKLTEDEATLLLGSVTVSLASMVRQRGPQIKDEPLWAELYAVALKVSEQTGIPLTY